MAVGTLKRFYKTAAVTPADGGFDVRLDGKPIRTPAGRALLLPSEALAAAIAAEWREQPEGGAIRPLEMPLMRLAATALDRVVPQRRKVIDDTARYAGSDLLCYRADTPTDLAVLREYLRLAGNKAALAKRLHLSRPALYKRLSGIEQTLGVHLDDAESMVSLHVAMLILEVRRGVDLGV